MRDGNRGPTVDEIRLAMTQLAGASREVGVLREQVGRLERRADLAEKELKYVLSLKLLTPADQARIEGLFL